MQSAEIQKQLAVEQHSLQAQEFADRYCALSDDPYRSCFAYSRSRLNDLLERYLPERGDGRRLLDVGCGTGHHMADLGRRGFEVAGIDRSLDMLDIARANNPGADIFHSDVEEIPFPDGSFDFVICIEVLRYLPDSSKCIAEMARVLSPGGVCLATAAPLLNLNGYWAVNRLAGLAKVGNLVRLKQFFATSWALRRKFEESGFRVGAVDGVYFGPINWVERIAPRTLPRFLKAWERVDKAMADKPMLREISNMFLVQAVKES